MKDIKITEKEKEEILDILPFYDEIKPNIEILSIAYYRPFRHESSLEIIFSINDDYEKYLSLDTSEKIKKMDNTDDNILKYIQYVGDTSSNKDFVTLKKYIDNYN